MLRKPTTKADLLPPFNYIGEANWEAKLRQLLVDYEVPLAQPCTNREIKECEKRLGSALSQSLKLFLSAFGPMNFDGVRLLLPEEIKTAESLWLANNLCKDEQKLLPYLLQIAEAVSDNIYALELESGQCYLCSHDPAGLFNWLPSFNAFIKMAIIDLSWGYYGWPDEAIERMAEELKAELFSM